ncbi:MAG: EpsI family protein [Planctomycetota bacterium]|nr:EpsI family protein [Planctomycetota bacterium]
MTTPELIVKPARNPWATGVAWLLLAAGLAVAFSHNFAEMWIRWFPAWGRTGLSLYDRIVEGESYYTHGPLIPLVSLLIVFLLLRHTSIPVRPWRRTGLIVLVLSLLLHLIACRARVNFASGFAFIGVLVGLVLLLWGGRALRRLWFPIAFLVFMVPLPDVTITNWNFTLRNYAAAGGVAVANALGVIAERMGGRGNQVILEGGKTLVIANVCNGLRTLISLLAFGALYAYVCRLRGVWRLGLFALTIPVAVIANSLRVVSLIIIADIWDTETATGFFHDFSGVLIFVLAFLMMFGLERLILWLRRMAGRPAEVLPLFHGARRTDDDEGQWSRIVGAVGGKWGGAAVVLVLLSAVGAWWLNRSLPAVWNKQVAMKALPAVLNIGGRDLKSLELPLEDRVLTILETRDYLNRRYGFGSPEWIGVCVIFSQDNRKGTHPPDLCLEGSGQGIVAKGNVVVSDVEGRSSVPCRELIVQYGRSRQYFLYTYKCGGRYTSSFWSQQLIIFVNGFLDRNASGALIQISTPVTTDVPDARKRCEQMIRAAIPHLDRGLP